MSSDTSSRINSDVKPLLFQNICCEYNMRGGADEQGIGTYNEKRLHRIIKDYFDAEESDHEVPYRGHVADIKNDTGIIEVQTGALNPLYTKLAVFLPEIEVTVVHPIIVKKKVFWIEPETGEISDGHLSPQRGCDYDGLVELFNIRSHLTNPRLHIRFMMIAADEYRFNDGWDRSGKRGSHRYEYIPTELYDIISIDEASDYMRFLPDGLDVNDEGFTKNEYSAMIPRSVSSRRRSVTYALNALVAAGVIKNAGKRKRANVYTLAE
ncbi:MAG: hypothetical protein LUD43_05170 [Firmicutes bacterium]|nr:hypothetical protein [Bacillota bacterium]